MKLKRRTFILGGLLVGAGGVMLGRSAFRRLDERCARVVRTISDRIIPGHGDVPGAVALGIDREIHDLFRQRRRSTLDLLLLTAALERIDFLALEAAEQEAIVRSRLEDGDKTTTTIYRECARRYLTRTETWNAIGYRTPQPHGYPDYTECSET